MRIPDGEARLCALYRDPETSEVSEESYLFGEVLAHDPSPDAVIACNGTDLAIVAVIGYHWEDAQKVLHWVLTPAGRSRLAWEASLLKERWRVKG